ncbi:hypothetical protein BGV03_16605, partial [Clostridioides difficile]|uniref:hypothetical protein n=1 Tax=Clostridioides difficile TaxID=1496 RepID=UPI000BC8A4BA
ATVDGSNALRASQSDVNNNVGLMESASTANQPQESVSSVRGEEETNIIYIDNINRDIIKIIELSIYYKYQG